MVQDEAQKHGVEALVPKGHLMGRRQSKAHPAADGRHAAQTQVLGGLQHVGAYVDAHHLAGALLRQQQRELTVSGAHVDHRQVRGQLCKTQEMTQTVEARCIGANAGSKDEPVIRGGDLGRFLGQLTAAGGLRRLSTRTLAEERRGRQVLPPVHIDETPGAVLAPQLGKRGVGDRHRHHMGASEMTDRGGDAVATQHHGNRLPPVLGDDGVQRDDEPANVLAIG